ncbi:hypothetical protein D1007_22671 [Hordeum vulgare]|nr:hypothetical protein D1007_22671 [Hordeum vulgare]
MATTTPSGGAASKPTRHGTLRPTIHEPRGWSHRRHSSTPRRGNTTACTLLFSDADSSFGASSNRSPLTQIKRESKELPLLRAVKREPEADTTLERQGSGIIGDFLPPAGADAIESAILARSAREEEEGLQRHRGEEEINVVLYKMGLTKALAFNEKEEEWRCEALSQEKNYVDLTFDED